MPDSLNSKSVNATKWSALAEILSKLITPITSMVMGNGSFACARGLRH